MCWVFALLPLGGYWITGESWKCCSFRDPIPSRLWWGFRIDPIRQGCFIHKKIHLGSHQCTHWEVSPRKKVGAKFRGMEDSVIWCWWLIAGFIWWISNADSCMLFLCKRLFSFEGLNEINRGQMKLSTSLKWEEKNVLIHFDFFPRAENTICIDTFQRGISILAQLYF